MKNRIIWKMFLLEIVTLGIYRLYWLIKTRNEMSQLNPNVKIKSPWFLLIPIIVLIVAFVIMVGGMIYSSASSTNCHINNSSNSTYSSDSTVNTSSDCPQTRNANIASLASVLVFYVFIFVALIVYVIWLWGYCHGVEIVTGEKLSFAICLVILILVPDGIDILIIQDSFNKIPLPGATSPISSQPQSTVPPVLPTT